MLKRYYDVNIGNESIQIRQKNISLLKPSKENKQNM